ncbi:MAG: hypothetical protein AAFZ89_01450 [Bacteroidota bacterium]
MKKKDLERYHELKSKRKRSTNELFELGRLSSKKRKQDFTDETIPCFEEFAKSYGFNFDVNLEELFTIYLKSSDLEIFFSEEHQPRKVYTIIFKFLIDGREENYNLASLISKKQPEIHLELNCFKEEEMIKVLHFIKENLFESVKETYETKTVYDKFLKLKANIKNVD